MGFFFDLSIKNSLRSANLPLGAKRSPIRLGLIIEARAPIRNLLPRTMSPIRSFDTKLNALLLQISPAKLPLLSNAGKCTEHLQFTLLMAQVPSCGAYWCVCRPWASVFQKWFILLQTNVASDARCAAAIKPQYVTSFVWTNCLWLAWG